MDLSHLIALQSRLAHEQERLAKSRTTKERALRSVWVAGIEKEIVAERKFLGLEPVECDLSDEELLKELQA